MRRLTRSRQGVKCSPADHVIYTAEDLQKADRIAAAQRTGKQCCTWMGRHAGVRETFTTADVSRCSKLRVRRSDLIDHLIGAGNQGGRHGEAERLCTLFTLAHFVEGRRSQPAREV